MEEDKMSTMEQAMTDMWARQAESDNRFDQILTAIARLSQLTQPLKSTNIPKVHPEPPLSRARPTTPPDFDGDHSRGMAFLNLCQTYIQLCLSKFLDKQTKIAWAMSYMKSGRAQKWTACIFHWEQQTENTNQSKYLDREVTHQVLKLLEENQLYLKLDKCEFEKTQVEYLGVIISHNSVEMLDLR